MLYEKILEYQDELFEDLRRLIAIESTAPAPSV